jgi:hypothetical protein
MLQAGRPGHAVGEAPGYATLSLAALTRIPRHVREVVASSDAESVF